MRPSSAAAAALLAAALLRAPATAWADAPAIDVLIVEGPAPAAHPTAILGYLKDKPYPVVAVDGDQAMIEKDGKRLRVPREAGYQAARAKGFLPGSIEVGAQDATANQVTRVYRFSNGAEVGGGVVSEGTAYRAKVVASRDYKECYVAIVFFDVGYLKGDTDNPGMAVAFSEIGDLRAGVETKVKADFGYLDFARHPMYSIPLFFSRGREIRTNFEDNSARLFRRIELLRHEKLLELYRQKNPAATLKAAPYLQFAPILPERANLSGVPAMLRVDFVVTADGTVEDVAPAAAVPDDVAGAIERTLEGWLFMPKLVNGVPRRESESLNLDFGPRPGQ